MKLQLHVSGSVGGLKRRVRELRAQLRGVDPAALAARAGVAYHPTADENGELCLEVLGEPLVVTTPDFIALEPHTRARAPLHTQALLLYHFCTTDGAPLTGRWISFRELPDGTFYHQAFQAYTGREITKEFQNDLPAFERAADSLGGRREPLGDAAFSFQALPRVPIVVVYWLGDEDLAPSAHLLFDSSAGHHLPTDAFAVLGNMLKRRLIAREGGRDSNLHVGQQA